MLHQEEPDSGLATTLVERKDEELSYVLLLRQIISIHTDAQSLGVAGLPAEEATAEGNDNNKKTKVNPIEYYQAELKNYKINLRRKHLELEFKENRAKSLAVRNRLISHLVKLDKERDPTGVTTHAIDRFKSKVIAWISRIVRAFERARVGLLGAKTSYAKFFTAGTRESLVDRWSNIERYWQEVDHINPRNSQPKAGGAASRAMAELKRLLWFKAVVEQCEDESRAHVVDAKLCEAYAKAQWASRMALIAHEIGIRFPPWIQSRAIKLMEDVEARAKSDEIFPTPQEANELLKKANKLHREVNEPLNGREHARALRSQLGQLLQSIENDRPSRRRKALERNDDQKVDLSNRSAVDIEEAIIQSDGLQFESEPFINPQMVREQQKQQLQKSLGATGARGVPAAVSARTARRYNI